ncbi:hypothetical protein ABFS82_06G164200 [Erythranthe guttata]|nr:PREDICTED: probable E3 ubiquitin-protein ligase ARI8 [Erythranthe guttata]|eukprot:XP_012834969.1 PREDICTED: probable E3 ubiquitin-protein ligase ARI8 [Erythranthe guttata]
MDYICYGEHWDLEDVDTRPPEMIFLFQIYYSCLGEKKISQLRDSLITEVSKFLSVSRGIACTLLVQNRWSTTLLYDKWFSDEKSVREAVGLLPEKQESPKQLDFCCCNICFGEIKIENTLSAPCGAHPFCLDCWKTYLTVSINNNGPGCLKMPCPEPGCKAYVGLDIVDSLASDSDKDKYYGYLSSSYVEGTLNLKWCPGPGCNLAIRLDEYGPKGYDVTCDCSHRFCWNCLEETHRPMDCETADTWRKQNTCFEADTVRWISSYTKPCPKCRRYIEKNHGCNHMTCGSPCGFQFCWLCLEKWSHDHYCNEYEDEKNEGESTSVDTDNSKYFDGYEHYYERWLSNHKSREIAVANLKCARNGIIETLACVQGEKKWKLMFVIDALEQIVECRLVLKWSYAYGYYLSLAKSKKMALFEYMQGDAEAALERLHHCAEKEIQKYVLCPSPDFNDFRVKLTNLTCAAQTYFENLVTAFEDDFRF